MKSSTQFIISYRLKFKYSTLVDELLLLTHVQVYRATRHLLRGGQSDNEILKKLFSGIRAKSVTVGHSDEAMSLEVQQLISLL